MPNYFVWGVRYMEDGTTNELNHVLSLSEEINDRHKIYALKKLSEDVGVERVSVKNIVRLPDEWQTEDEEKTTYRAKLTYFKQSGEYHSEKELELLPEEIENHYKIVRLSLIAKRMQNLSAEKKLPGICGDWLGEKGNILITFSDKLLQCSAPHLIQAN